MIQNEQGNAVAIILIAVALFGGLTFTLSRSMDGGNSNELTNAEVQIAASRLMTYASEVESSINQMLFNGAEIDDLDFILPSDAAFETGSDIYKVFHPDGGGMNYRALPENVKYEILPGARWFLGRFSNVEWTQTTAEDIILTAYQIREDICSEINKKITGSISIPSLTDSMNHLLIPGYDEDDLTTTECASCEGYSSLCVSNQTGTAWSYYTIVASQ